VTWRAVARVADLPVGSMRRVTIDDHDLLLANSDGNLFATDDLCTHEDASLSSGALYGELVTCPLHGSRFCLRTGTPQDEPAEEALDCYGVRIEGKRIEVSFP